MADLGAGARPPGRSGLRLVEVGRLVAHDLEGVAALHIRDALCREPFQLDGLHLRAVLFPLEAALTMPYVQEALDAQCGTGIQADPAFYHNDPNIAWLGEDAGCQYLGIAGGWECYCEP